MHLTVEFDSPIVVDLRAQATSPEERLRRISERVQLPCHAYTEAYFRLAQSLSQILVQVEQGLYNNPAAAPLLYEPVINNVVYPTRPLMMAIIADWSSTTGRDMRARRVSVERAAVNGRGARAAVPVQ